MAQHFWNADCTAGTGHTGGALLWRELLIGFVRGIQAIRSFGELVAAVFYSAAHWFLVALVYLWVSHAFGGSLGTLNLGDALLVLAFTLAGSAVQLPGVGGGAQVATFIAFTAVLGVEKGTSGRRCDCPLAEFPLRRVVLRACLCCFARDLSGKAARSGATRRSGRTSKCEGQISYAAMLNSRR